MTDIVLEYITHIEEISMFSKAYQEGKIPLNITKIAKHLKKDRKTVHKYLRGEVPKHTRQRTKYMDEYREILVNVLSDKYQSFDYMDHLYKYLKREHGIRCNRSTLNRYIRKDEELNELFKRKKENGFTERFETKPGEQAQFDIKERVKVITDTGEVITTYIPTLTLSWSRYNVRRLTLDTKVETLLSFLAESFEEIGGIPKELVIDNLKAFVETPRYKGQEAQLTNAFSEFLKDYSIQAKPCMPYRPQTKGKTETQNKVVDQLKNYNGRYHDLIDIHDTLARINEEDNHALSQATKFPRIFLLNKEKGDLLPLPRKEIRQKYHLSLKEVIVSNESLVSYKSNKYSVPKEFIGRHVGLTIKRDELHIYYTNKIIAIHPVTQNLLNIKKEHHLHYPTRHQPEDKNNHILLKEMEHIHYD